MRYSVTREFDIVEDFIKQKGQLHCTVVQDLDLSQADINW